MFKTKKPAVTGTSKHAVLRLVTAVMVMATGLFGFSSTALADETAQHAQSQHPPTVSDQHIQLTGLAGVLQSSGTAPPDPDVYPARFGMYTGPGALNSCLVQGQQGLAAGAWSAYYCWITAEEGGIATVTELWVG